MLKYTTAAVVMVALVWLFIVTASAALADDTIWDTYVTVEICQVELHPTGRTVAYDDSEGRSGTVNAPDTVTLEFPNGGWVDVTVNHIPGDETSTPITRRFEVEPCPTPSSTTVPETTTTANSSTTTSTAITTTSTVAVSTTTVTEPDATTTTSQDTTTTAPETTTTGRSDISTTTHQPATTTTTTPVPDCTDEDAGVTCLPATGISTVSILVAALTLLGSGGVAVWRTT